MKPRGEGLGVLIAASALGAFLSALSLSIPSPARAGGIHAELSTISGQVIYAGRVSGPIIVEAYDRPQFSPRPVSSATLTESGAYEIQIRPGSYYLRAFVDGNNNGRWDPEEPVGIYSGEQALVIVPLASKMGINVLIPLPKGSAVLKEESR